MQFRRSAETRSVIQITVLAVLLCFAAAPARTQNAAVERTIQQLSNNARSLEKRSRPDLALQVWQQVLFSDPQNAEAMAGVARDYKLMGKQTEAAAALDRLRAAHPNDPNIAKIQAMSGGGPTDQSDELRRAGNLARAGNNAEAMRVYRQLYDDHPPEGDVALAYYQTLYGTPGGKQEAIDGLRGLMKRNPGDARYAIALGRILTYDTKTRPEGIRLLRAHSNGPGASDALRQALVWESANPSSAADLRAWLKAHPGDAELAAALKTNEAQLAKMNSGIARTPEERAAFAALNAKRLDEAQRRFQAILDRDPKNPRAAAGMGFLRMQQNNFAAAISYLMQAEQNGFRDRSVTTALENARFYSVMNDATLALKNGQADIAIQQYRAALAMRPNNPDAMNGLAGALTNERQYAQAVEVYASLLKLQPQSVDAWRGLFLAYAQSGQNDQALALVAQCPDSVTTALNRDPNYLRTLAAIYNAHGRTADAQRVLAQALALPFPANGAGLKTDTRMQYAAILMAANRFSQAAEMYTRILDEDGTDLNAWMGLVSAEHQMNQDQTAISDVEKMPPTVYESAMNNVDFLTMLGAIYQQANRYDIAQQLMERAAKLEEISGTQPSVAIELQLASIYLQRNNTTQAYGIYRQVLQAHPDSLDAWKGLIAALQATNHTNEAVQQIAYIPPAVLTRLEADPQFEQTEASLYAAAGEYAHAAQEMNRATAYYARLGQPMPSSPAIQQAWLLYNTKNDRLLYPALMRLGGRADLTIDQRKQVQTIWANWAVTRAGTAFDSGNNERAVEILEAAAAAFPENAAVKRVLAGGYLKTGHAKAALVLYKSVPNDDASAADFQGEISAALAANDKAQAEEWLREALARYPGDYRVLGAAAQFEQARGDSQRAADYWKAALAALPPGSPTDRLAHELAYPDSDTKPHKATTAADLARLLNPEDESFQKTIQLPPLPSYGPDPYLGKAPVVLPDSSSDQQVAQQNPYGDVPTTTQVPVQPAPQPAQQTQSAAPPVLTRHRRHKKADANNPAQNQIQNQGQTTLPAVEEIIPVQPSTQQPVAPQQNSQPVFIPMPNSQTAPQQPAPLYLPGQTTQPAQQNPSRNRDQVPAIVIPQEPQAGNHSFEHFDIQTGLRASDLENHPVPYTPPAPNRAAVQPTSVVLIVPPQLEQVRPLANAPITLPSSPLPERPVTQEALVIAPAAMQPVQYTPSAQQAATGAYSAPQQKATPAPVVVQTQPATTQAAPAAPAHPRRKKRAAKPAAQPVQTQSVPTLVTAPAEAQQQPAAIPAPEQSAQEPAGATDQQLEQQSLPPLRGPWVRVQRQPRPVDPREMVERQLQSLESSYSPWLGGTGLVNARSGNLGYDHLVALEAPFEASAPFGYSGRITVVARPAFLDSGQADGSAIIQVQESTQSGTELVNIPEPLGTDINTGPNATTNATGTPPPQQNATGFGGEVQLVFPHLALAAGHTPYGFLVSNWTGRLRWQPGGGPFTVTLTRDSVKETQLSYAGMRDPGSASLSYPGNIWGGVVSNAGEVQFARGDELSGFYISAGGQALRGYNTQSNSRYDGDGGAYWRVWTLPEYGSLTVGANFFGMHYAHNQSAYTYGMGGYFSPQAFFLASIPMTWTGHYQTRWHYTLAGNLGVQAFQEDKTPLFPLAGQQPTEIALNNAALPAFTSVGANYNLRGAAAYQLGEHWFIGGFLSANNTSNYNAVSTGFSIHYLFRRQPSAAAAPTGLFPTDGFRPFTVP